MTHAPKSPVRLVLIALAALALLGSACSSDSESDSSDESSQGSDADANGDDTQAMVEDITILVTNDDGVGSEGIDELVNALEARDGVEVVVVAPLENQSGSGGKTTEGELAVSETTTASGHPATAVDGFPADAVIWALGEGGIEPDLVISGINDGQNIGPLSRISGTVGAARQAAQLGVPAVATSQGFGDPVDFPTGVSAVMDWLDENDEAIRNAEMGTDQIVSINIPTCPTGEVQGVAEVPVLLETDLDLVVVDCAGTEEPTSDVVGFVNGWVVVTSLEPTGSSTE